MFSFPYGDRTFLSFFGKRYAISVSVLFLYRDGQSYCPLGERYASLSRAFNNAGWRCWSYLSPRSINAN